MTTPRLLPPPYAQFYDTAGKPLSGGLVYFYSSGSSTLGKVYADAEGNSRKPNPVKLDAAGRAEIYLDTDVQYDLVVRSAAGSLIYEQDSVKAVQGVISRSTHETDEVFSGTSAIPTGSIVDSITGATGANIQVVMQDVPRPSLVIKNVKLQSDMILESNLIDLESDLNIKDSNGNVLFKITGSSTNSYMIYNEYGVTQADSTGDNPSLVFPSHSYAGGLPFKVRYRAKGSGYVYLNGYRFPNSNGSAGQKLQTNGSKVLSWA